MTGRPWTAEENQYMSTHYIDTYPKDIAIILGRSVPSVIQHAQKLNLKCKAPRNYPKKRKKTTRKIHDTPSKEHVERFNKLLSILIYLRSKPTTKEISTSDLVDKTLALVAQGEIDLGV